MGFNRGVFKRGPDIIRLTHWEWKHLFYAVNICNQKMNDKRILKLVSFAPKLLQILFSFFLHKLLFINTIAHTAIRINSNKKN